MSIASQVSSSSYRSNRSLRKIRPEDLEWSDEEDDINIKYATIKPNTVIKTEDSDDDESSTMYDDTRKLRDIDDSSLIDREGRLCDHKRSMFSGSVKVDKYKSNKITSTKKPIEYKQAFPSVPYNVKEILGKYISSI